MDMERAAQTIQRLEASLREQGIQTAFDESIPDRPGLRTLLPIQEGKPVRMDLHYVPCGELFDVLQLYTVIAGELNEQALMELDRAAYTWNFSIFLGSLAIRTDLRHFYHRYCLVLSRHLSAGECAVMSESVLVSILKYIAPLQEDILALARGVMTFEQLQEKQGQP